MNQITLRLVGDTWMARYSGPHAALVVSAFGTDTIPTAYLARMPFSTLQRELGVLNPGASIHCAHARTSSTPGVGVIVCADCGMRW